MPDNRKHIYQVIDLKIQFINRKITIQHKVHFHIKDLDKLISNNLLHLSRTKDQVTQLMFQDNQNQLAWNIQLKFKMRYLKQKLRRSQNTSIQKS
jgi:hypothetical protein